MAKGAKGRVDAVNWTMTPFRDGVHRHNPSTETGFVVKRFWGRSISDVSLVPSVDESMH